MSKKRISLADVINEDERRASLSVVPKSAPVAPQRTNDTMQDVPQVSFEKLSVTLPASMHEELLDLARERRRAKQPYKLSQLVREALAEWLPHQQ